MKISSGNKDFDVLVILVIVTTIITLSPLKDKDASDHIVYLHPVYRTFVYLSLQDTSALRDEINFRQFQTNAFSQHKKKKINLTI